MPRCSRRHDRLSLPGQAIQPDEPAGKKATGMLVSRRPVAQPFAQGPEENQGQADLFGLPLPSAGIEQSRLAHPLDQARQTEDHRHPMVRMRRFCQISGQLAESTTSG